MGISGTLSGDESQHLPTLKLGGFARGKIICGKNYRIVAIGKVILNS
jgi:hypothetical protein